MSTGDDRPSVDAEPLGAVASEDRGDPVDGDTFAWDANPVTLDDTERIVGTTAVFPDTGLTLSSAPLAAPTAGTVALGDRYLDLGRIGRGGMGEVRRVLDRKLHRTMALKAIHPDLLDEPEEIARFTDEAQVTAQLQHPAIIPVHDAGTLPDGRVYFTMQEVVGRTLREVIAAVHAGTGAWSSHKLVDAFHRACEAVAYAHSRGVVHRDLKPHNIMVGDWGEVFVLDWGLARVRGRADEPRPIRTGRLDAGLFVTRVGRVAGTPAYMPPEQAKGLPGRIGPASDVYSLCAVLFEILSGHAPQPLTREDQAPDIPQGALPIPEPLRRICQKGMSPDPAHRYRNATSLAAEVGAWLEGARKREEGLTMVAHADELAPRASALRAEAAKLRDQARARLAKVKPWEPVARKQPAWEQEDRAAAIEQEALGLEVETTRLLHAALQHDPELTEAHDRLADHYRAAHDAAEATHDAPAAARAELLVRAHDRGRHAAWLAGVGALTIVTDPPGADAVLCRVIRQDRRLVPVFDRHIGVTPIRDLPLDRGSYIVHLRHPDRAPVRYPVFIERGGRWDGVPPGETDPAPVMLPRPDALGPDDVVIPAGPFAAGGDPETPMSGPRRVVWVDGFVIRRHPVTNREYLTFLNDLVARGQEAEALKWSPRERGGTLGREGALIYGRDPDGRFVLQPDPEGDDWLPDYPVFMVTWACAAAYARWESARTGQRWRLPSEWAWEKAARGVDGRLLPWGDFLDPTWACMRDSHPGRPLPAVVTDWPDDESVYGVRGVAGNARDWCAEIVTEEGPPAWVRLDGPPDPEDPGEALRALRGGAWYAPAGFCHPACRASNHPGDRDIFASFRLARALMPGE